MSVTLDVVPYGLQWKEEFLLVLNGLDPPFIETSTHHENRLLFSRHSLPRMFSSAGQAENDDKCCIFGGIRDFSEKQCLECGVGEANLSRSVQEMSWVSLPSAMNNLKEELFGGGSFHDQLHFEKGNSDGDQKRCHRHPHVHLVPWMCAGILISTRLALRMEAFMQKPSR